MMMLPAASVDVYTDVTSFDDCGRSLVVLTPELPPVSVEPGALETGVPLPVTVVVSVVPAGMSVRQIVRKAVGGHGPPWSAGPKSPAQMYDAEVHNDTVVAGHNHEPRSVMGVACAEVVPEEVELLRAIVEGKGTGILAEPFVNIPAVAEDPEAEVVAVDTEAVELDPDWTVDNTLLAVVALWTALVDVL